MNIDMLTKHLDNATGKHKNLEELAIMLNNNIRTDKLKSNNKDLLITRKRLR